MELKSGSENARASLKSGGTSKGARKSVSGEPATRAISAAPSKRPSKIPRSPSPQQTRGSTSPQKASDTQRARQASAASSRSPAKEERQGSAVALTSVPPQATTDALATINYAAFAQSSLSAKQRRARMLKDFLAAHSSGAQRIAEECERENEALWNLYLRSSHAPHSREIQRLLNHAQHVEVICQKRLQHANAVTRCALSGIEELLTRLTDSGTRISAETQVLSGEPDAVLATRAKGAHSDKSHEEYGTPLEEVRGFDPCLPEPHPPAFRVSEADRAEVSRLKDVFHRAMESITARKDNGSYADASQFASPLKPLSKDDLSHKATTAFDAGENRLPTSANRTRAEGGSPAVTSSSPDTDQNRLRQVEELHRELNTVGDAFISLMKRVEVQHQHYQSRISAQRDALDAAATRTKLADDVLRDTVDQGEVEASSAVAEVHQLSLHLRKRMAASEVAMQAALDALIKESAEVCIANDALHDYAALTLNRENCLYAYMTRMERQVVEQADVLRQAQDTVTRLWSRLHARPKPQAKNGGTETTPTQTGCQTGGNTLPPLYEELLRQSDRATLLSLVEQVSQYSAEVAAVVVRGLDEHQARNALNPIEAAKAREAHQRAVMTQQLLEKLDAEGHLRSNARETTLPLSERVAHLVAQYDAYIDFNEQYARALVRQADVERREQSPSQFTFFDSRTPTPGSKGVSASAAAAQTKSGHGSVLPRSYAAISSTKLGDGDAPGHSLPYLKLWESKQKRQHSISAASSTRGLSGTDPTNTAASTGGIVNYLVHNAGRAGAAHEHVPSPPRSAIGGSASSVMQSAQRLRRHTAVSATGSPGDLTAPPPPPVPPRAGLTSYVLSNYSGKGEDAVAAVGDAAHSLPGGKSPANRVMPYRDGDRQFIEREREVFQQLD